LSSLRKRDPIAILCSDIHLSSRAPLARSSEEDWFKAMARPLNQLADLSERLNCPVLCAGDLFHRWNSSPELINFAMEHLPKTYPFYAIPGQHDLPNHRLDLISKSAYWTLVWSGHIIDLSFGEVGGLEGDFFVSGVPYGEIPSEEDLLLPFREAEKDSSGFISKEKMIFLTHQYLWYGEKKHEGADASSHIARVADIFPQESIVVVGDNHKPFDFSYAKRRNYFFNCGGFMRRNLDEKDLNPSVGVIFADGTIQRVYLDISEENFIEAEEDLSEVDDPFEVDVTNLLKEIGALRVSGVDFAEAVRRYLNSGVSAKTRDIILEALE